MNDDQKPIPMTASEIERRIKEFGEPAAAEVLAALKAVAKDKAFIEAEINELIKQGLLPPRPDKPQRPLAEWLRELEKTPANPALEKTWTDAAGNGCSAVRIKPDGSLEHISYEEFVKEKGE